MRRWFFLLALVGCQRTEAVPKPDLEGLASVLLVSLGDADSPGVPNAPVIDGQRVTMVQALDLEEDAAWPTFFADQELYALPYRCPLNALGIAEGPQVLMVDPVENLDEVQLPRPLRTQRRGAAGGPWVGGDLEAPAIHDLFRRLTVDRRRCEKFSPTLSAQELPEAVSFGYFPSFALPSADGSAHFSSFGGPVWQLKVDGNLAKVPVDGLSAPLITAARAADDYWLLYGRGGLARGPLQGEKRLFGGSASLPTAPTSLSAMVAMVGGPEEDPVEVFLVTQDRSLQRYDGRQWTELSRGRLRTWKYSFDGGGGGPINVDAEYLPKLVRLGPRKVASAGVTDRDDVVVYWDQGELTEEVIPGVRNVLSLGQDAAGRLVVGNDRGEVYVRESDGWRPSGLDQQEAIIALWTEGRALLLSGVSYYLRYDRDSRACRLGLSGFVGLHSARLGNGDRLLVGGSAFGLASGASTEASTGALWIRQTGAGAECGEGGY
ncbi:MAG: hypothetical protein IPG45_18680 [Deltaproteobacteria bacterium]|nr:hypothetical protein [Deltaproteobacteria bacterium]